MAVESPVLSRSALLRLPMVVVAASFAVVALGASLRLGMAVSDGRSWDLAVVLVPWVGLTAGAVWAIFAQVPVRLFLAAALVVASAFLAGPRLLFLALPWLDTSLGGVRFDVYGISSLVEIVGLLALIVGAAWLLITMLPYLLSLPPRTSFGIDTTILITAFAVLVLMTPGPASILEIVNGNAFPAFLTMVWAVPVVLALAVLTRQGGAIAIGAAVGLLVALWVFDWVMQALEALLGGIGLVTDTFLQQDVSAYAVIPALLLILVTVWWSLNRNAGGNAAQPISSSSSPINATAVLAFCLSWIPLTAIPAAVLGHMAFDQIVDGETAQRGIGLARWSIIVAYVSILGAAVLAANWVR